MRTRAQIEADLEWKLARLHDAQEHSIMVRLEREIEELCKVLARPEGKE